MAGVLLDQRSFHRLAQVVRQAEADPGAPRYDASGVLPNWQHVRIMGDGQKVGGSGGSGSGSGLTYYPGYVERWDAPDERAVVLGLVWVREGNMLPLENGYLYAAQQSGPYKVGADERPLFVVSAVGGGVGSPGSGGETVTLLGCARNT